MNDSSGSGVCQLTKNYGRFVECHLIPKSLTRPRIRGNHFIQSRHGDRPSRRWSSWYDDRLVIRKGEDVLRDYDTWAIRELRKHQLVWSGFDKAGDLPDRIDPTGHSHGFRNIVGIDRHRLRLFFLSLLWRSGASNRKEVAEIDVPPNDLEKLRMMLLNKDTGSLSFYPTVLVQLSTIGPAHNHAPCKDETPIGEYGGDPSLTLPVYRFYFDGLIAHIHRGTNKYVEGYADLGGVVGARENLLLHTVTFEASAQAKNLQLIRERTDLHYPNRLPNI